MNHGRRALWAAAVLCLLAPSSWAETDTASDAKTAPAETKPAAAAEATGPAYVMSPFEVSSANDDGYTSQQTMVGSRSAKDLVDLPTSVSIINREMLDDLNPVDGYSAIKYGTASVGQNQTINDDVNIRGFRTTQAMRNGVTKTLYKRNPMYDIERIEVIKGPAGMLLGNNDYIGGVVNYVSRKPTATPQGEIKTTFGDNNYVRGEVNSSGPLYSSSDLTVLYRATVGATDGNREKAMESDNQKFVGGAFQLFFGPEKSSSLAVNWYYNKDDSWLYWDDFLDITSTTVAKLNPYSTKSFSSAKPGDAFWNLSEEFVDLEYLAKLTENGNLRVYFQHDESSDQRRTVRGITVQADNYTLNRQDLPAFLGTAQDTLQLDYLHRLTHRFFVNDFSLGADYTKAKTFSISWPAGTISALDTRTDDVAADNLPATDRSYDKVSAHTVSRSETVSYYFQDNVSFWQDRIILVGGLRWYNTRSTGRNYVAGTSTESDTGNIRTHRYGAIVKPLPNLSLYYTNAQNVIPQTGYTTEEIPQPYQNQRGKLKEFGAKLDYKLGKKINVFATIAHYDMALTNVSTQTNAVNSLGQIIYVQSERDTSKGWESSSGIGFNFANGRLDATLNYYDQKTHAAGTTLTTQNSPENGASALLKYGWTGGTLEGLTIGGGVMKQGKKRNTSWTVETPDTYSLFARYRFNKHWSTQLNIENLTDERYIVAVTTSGLVQSAEPRTIRVTADYKW